MTTILNDKADVTREFAFTAQDFTRVRNLIYQRAGIALSEGKHQMVYSRLARRLRATGLRSFTDYLDQLQNQPDGAEWEAFTNALTTNLTSFFREAHHFPLLAAHVRKKSGHIEIWCSAASTGEEPYSIAMTACEAFNSLTPPVRITATDIATNVLAVAQKGIYPIDKIGRMDDARLKRFFLRGKGAQEGMVKVRPELQQLITFQQLNLLDAHWAVKGPFDAIFCRNVMIYFDKPTQSKILARFAPLMQSDGLLFAGHSENFLYVSDAFRLRGKTVYELEASPQSRAVGKK